MLKNLILSTKKIEFFVTSGTRTSYLWVLERALNRLCYDGPTWGDLSTCFKKIYSGQCVKGLLKNNVIQVGGGMGGQHGPQCYFFPNFGTFSGCFFKNPENRENSRFSGSSTALPFVFSVIYLHVLCLLYMCAKYFTGGCAAEKHLVLMNLLLIKTL